MDVLNGILRKLSLLQKDVDRMKVIQNGNADQYTQVTQHGLDSTTHTGFLSWSKVSKSGSKLSDLETRNYLDLNSRTHNIIGDHSIDNSAQKFQLIGASQNSTLGFLTPSSDVSSGSESILKSSSSGSLSLNTLNSNTISASSNLTIDPSGLVLFPNTQTIQTVTHNSTSFPIQGFSISNVGGNRSELSINSISVDEFRTKFFVADEVRVDRGTEWISRSYGILSRAFTTPSLLNSSVTIYFENSPMIPGAIFLNNEWIVFRVINTSTGFTAASIWGKVSDYNLVSSTEQSWTFTMTSGPTNYEIGKSGFANGFGVDSSNPLYTADQGYVVTSVVDPAGSPYISIQTWAGANPYNGTTTTRVRIGKLFASDDSQVFANNTNPGWGFFSDNAYLRGIIQTGNARLDDNGLQIYTPTSATVRQSDIVSFAKNTDKVSYANFQGYWGSTTVNGRISVYDSSRDGYLYLESYANTSRNAIVEIKAKDVNNDNRTALIGLRSESTAPGRILLWADYDIELRVPFPVNDATVNKINVQGSVVPMNNEEFNLGAQLLRWNNIYAKNLYVESTIGGQSLSGSTWTFTNNMVIDAKNAAATTLTILNSGGGSLSALINGSLSVSTSLSASSASITNNLSVGGNISVNGTVDGVDILLLSNNYSSHASNTQIHVGNNTAGNGLSHSSGQLSVKTGVGIEFDTSNNLRIIQSIGGSGLSYNITNGQLSVNLSSGLTLSGDDIVVNRGDGLAFSGSVLKVDTGPGLSINNSKVRLDPIAAGLGLVINESTGALSVGSGNLISIDNDSIRLSNGTAQYQVPVTGPSAIAPTPSFVPTYTLLSSFAGTGLDFINGEFVLPTPGTLTHNSTSSSSNAHTHAITSSDSVSSAQTSLLKATNGSLTVDSLTGTTRLRSPRLDTASGNMTIAPSGELFLDPGGNDVLPQTGYDINLGMLTRKFLTLHAAELWVETLVAQNTIATIGGRILVGPTTTLIDDLSTGSGTIDVKHNQMSTGDIVYMEADGKVEFMQILSGTGTYPTPITGGFRYNVTRGYGSTGANLWYAGDAIFNTGKTNNGFIDLYSIRGIKAGTEIGPTIVGNVRTGTNFNDWQPRWAIGNLNGLYNYSTNIYGFASGNSNTTWISADQNNGFRIMFGSTTRFQVDINGNLEINDSTGATRISLNSSGNASFTGTITALSGNIAGWGILSDVIFSNNIGLYSGVIGTARLQVGNTGYVAGIASAGSTNDITFWAGASHSDRANASFRVTAGGILTATGVDVTGKITAQSGTVGGWALGTSSLTAGSSTSTVGLSSSTTAGAVAIYAGSTTPTTAPFRVTNQGAVTIGTNGSLTWAGGKGVANSDGIYLIPDGVGESDDRAYLFKDNTNTFGGLYAFYTAGASPTTMTLRAKPNGSQNVELSLLSEAGTATLYAAKMTAFSSTTTSEFRFNTIVGATSTRRFTISPTLADFEINLAVEPPSGTTTPTERNFTVKGTQSNIDTDYAKINFNNIKNSYDYPGASITARITQGSGANDYGSSLVFFTGANTFGGAGLYEAMRIDHAQRTIFAGPVTFNGQLTVTGNIVSNVTISKSNPTVTLSATSGLSNLTLSSADNGNSIGQIIVIGRNSSATTANQRGGVLRFIDAGDTARNVWAAADGVLRINTSAPNQAGNVADGGGNVVGAQTSHESYKTIIEGQTPIADVMARLAAVAAHVHRFQYLPNSGGPMNETFEGIVLRENAPETHHYGTDKYEASYSAGS